MHFSKETKVIKLLIIQLVVICTSPLVIGQTLEAKLAQNVGAFDSDSSSTIEQLVELAERFQIPMGIEWLYTPHEKPSRSLHVRKGSVEDVLRAALQQQPGYQFTKTDGTIHVFAPSLINDPRNFLDLRLPKFRVENESLFGAEYRLRISIQQLLHPSPGFGGGYGGVGLNNDFHVHKITFSGTNLTVRQILNRIATVQGNALWVIRLKPSQMMRNEPFYSQTASLTADDAALDFSWQFIPFRNGAGPLRR